MKTVMAGYELVFHNFLGIGCKDIDGKEDGKAETERIIIDVRDEEGVDEPMTASSPSSGRYRTSSDHSLQVKAAMRSQRAEMLCKSELDSWQGKRGDPTNSKEPFQEHAHGLPQNMDSFHPLKVSCITRQDDRRYRHRTYGVDDVHRNHVASYVYPSSIAKLNPSMVVPNRLGSSDHALPSRDKLGESCSREKIAMPPLPPADEGSRTGLKASSLASLLNGGSANLAKSVPCPSLTTRQTKSYSQNVILDSAFMPSKPATARSSQQLTICYGGQAHVFDDMPSDKVDAIMNLAGSSGRSWSMVYTESICMKKQDIKEMSASTAGDTGKDCT